MNNDVDWWGVPSGVMRAETPTLETCTTERPCSIARIRLIASCWTDSSVKPNVALFVWIEMRLAPSRTLSRTTSSTATSKQMLRPTARVPPAAVGTRKRPIESPGAKSRVTRSTLSEKSRKKER